MRARGTLAPASSTRCYAAVALLLPAMASALSKAFPVALKEVRLHYSPVGTTSAGARYVLRGGVG